MYIQEYIKGVLNSFKLFFTRCIIKRLNSKIFILIYYYRRPVFNYKNFINFKVFNKRFKKFKKLNFATTFKKSSTQNSSCLSLAKVKNHKIQKLSKIILQNNTKGVLTPATNVYINKVLQYNKYLPSLFFKLFNKVDKGLVL